MARMKPLEKVYQRNLADADKHLARLRKKADPLNAEIAHWEGIKEQAMAYLEIEGQEPREPGWPIAEIREE